MPSPCASYPIVARRTNYNRLSDQDLGAIIAYVLPRPAVDNVRTSVELNPVAGLLVDLGLFGEVMRTARIDFDAPRQPANDDPGGYLIEIGGCHFCHGSKLTGGQGPEPGAPAAPDLTASGPLKNSTFAAFAESLRGGFGVSGRRIEPKYMPWLGYRYMTDEELIAIWRFCGHSTSLPGAP